VKRDARDERIEALERENRELRAQVRELMKRIEKLERELGRSSRNSSQPPSADAPKDRAERPSRPAGIRKPGGQPGHEARSRELVPEEQVTETFEYFPSRCLDCGERLPQIRDNEPVRHQVVELPEIAPEVTEHRLHRVRCGCGRVSCATLPVGVPSGMCGPRLMAFVALLTGYFHVSRRQAAVLLDDVLHVRLSLGTVSRVEERVSEVLAAPAQEAHDQVLSARVKHVDATTWRQSGQYRALWTIATRAATVFLITANAKMPTVQKLLHRLRGFLSTDRGSQFGFWAMHMRQICWAHLLRRFVAFSEERQPEVARLGEALVLLTRSMFHEWHRVRDGTRSRAEFQCYSQKLRAVIETLLERGVSLGVTGVSGSCADILAHREALWTFADKLGIEPTNNEAERALRGFVLWRKKSFGSQSERGNRFAERIMTVTHTLRKQDRHVLSFLTDVCSAAIENRPIPSLIV
jgi:transposase